MSPILPALLFLCLLSLSHQFDANPSGMGLLKREKRCFDGDEGGVMVSEEEEGSIESAVLAAARRSSTTR